MNPAGAGQPSPGAAPRESRLRAVLSGIFSYPVALAVGLVTVTMLSAFGRLDNPDLWWHLRLGEGIWNTHRLPSADSFSFTASGQPRPPQEWLSQLGMYGVYQSGGYLGLVVAVALIASLIYLMVYLLCWVTTGNALVSFRSGMIAYCFGSVGVGTRPLLAGHLFLAAEILILEVGRRRNPRILWILPVMFAVWVNCHGSWAFGLAVLVLYVVCSMIEKSHGLFVPERWDARSRRTLECALAVSIAALCANPVGIRLLLYPFDTLFQQKSMTGSVSEWQPPSLGDVNTLLMLAAVGAAFFLAASRRLSLREFALTCLASGLAVRHSRMLFLFGIIISPVLCHMGWGGDSRRKYPLANAAIILGCLIAVIWALPDRSALQKQVQANNPVQAVEYIRRTHLADPMLNEYRFGGYLIWSLPERKVFIDGRSDVYDWSGVLDRYLRWVTLEDDPQVLLNQYRIGFCLLDPSSAIAHLMPYVPGWEKVYADANAVIFSRGPQRINTVATSSEYTLRQDGR